MVFSLYSKALDDARRMVKRRRVSSEMPSIIFNLLSCASPTPWSSLVAFKSESEKKDCAMKRVLVSAGFSEGKGYKAPAGLLPSRAATATATLLPSGNARRRLWWPSTPNFSRGTFLVVL